MKPTASETLNTYAIPIVQALKAIVREPVFVSTKPHPHLPVGLGADILIARDRILSSRLIEPPADYGWAFVKACLGSLARAPQTTRSRSCSTSQPTS